MEPYLEPLPVSAKARALWPVWPKYAKLRRLEALPLPQQYAYAHSVMTPDARLMLVKNSKAGCTTAAQKLFELATGDTSGNVHQEREVLLQGKLAWRAFEAAQTGETVIFSITRHPVSRTVSAFKDFVLEAGNPDAKRHVAPLAARGIKDAESEAAKFDVFLDYIAETLALSPERCDRHWRPQVLNLAMEQITYTRIFKLEDYACGMAEVLALAGYSVPTSDTGKKSHFNASRSGFHASAEQAARIAQLYAKDMQAFGYS